MLANKNVLIFGQKQTKMIKNSNILLENADKNDIMC